MTNKEIDSILKDMFVWWENLSEEEQKKYILKAYRNKHK